MMIRLIGTCLVFTLFLRTGSGLNGVWRYECKNGFCQKTPITPETEETAMSLPACRLLCSDAAAIWPKPTGEIHIGDNLVKVNPNSINALGLNFEAASHSIMNAAMKRFKQQLETQKLQRAKLTDGGKTLEIKYILAQPDVTVLDLTTEEGYALTVNETSDGRLNAVIVADNIFGGRNGLETLNQLIVYDDLRDEYVMPNDVSITDKPAYAWRSIGLDTARNFVTVETIKRTLDAMGASKLNTFHWHITDSHSFPFTSESFPELTKYGAYTPLKVYTPEDVADVVKFGLERGVRVVPEFDAPAHVGEGWQNSLAEYVVCFNAKPWQSYCVEPPCGQFDPTKEKLYDVIEGIYGDMLKQFKPTVFHMGGDEVHFGCWNSTTSIVEWMQSEKGWGSSEEDFVKLWDLFQNESLTRLYKQAGKQIPAIMWTSTLTKPEFLHYLPKDQYIIQIWTEANDSQVINLLDKGYRVILSNYDALYLDCGFSGWVTDGNNWCSPYKGWQLIYENKPAKLAGDKKNLVLGAEAPLWTEQVDSAAVDSRIWPRAAALAEVLWTEPTTSWRKAESRFIVQRERLINLGVNADAIVPEWCRQFEESCPIDGFHNPDDSTTGGVTSKSINLIFIFVNIIMYLNLNFK